MPRRPRPPPAEHQHRAGRSAAWRWSAGSAGSTSTTPSTATTTSPSARSTRTSSSSSSASCWTTAAARCRLAYMIDASHNLKDPLEDLIQATDQIQLTIAQALLVDRDALADAQDDDDPARAAEVLHRGLSQRRPSDRRRGPAPQRRRPRPARHLPRRRVPRRDGRRARRRRRGRDRPVTAPVRRAVVAVDFGATSIRVCRVDARRPPASRRRRPPLRPRSRCATAGGPALGLGRGSSPRSSGAWPGGRAGPAGLDRRRHVGRRLRPARRARRARRAAGLATATTGPRATRAMIDASARPSCTTSTGVQVQPFNTIFQLAAHDRDELGRGAHVLLLPELVVHHLTGEVVRRTHERGHHRPGRPRAPATGRRSCSTRSASTPASCPRSAGRAPGRDVAGHPGAPGRRARHRLGGGGMGAGAGRARRSSPPAPGCWSGGSGPMRTGARPPGERTSPTNRARSAASGLRNVAGFWLIEQCRPGLGRGRSRAWWPPPGRRRRTGGAVVRCHRRSVPAPRRHARRGHGRPRHRPDIPRPLRHASIIESMAATTAGVLDDLGDGPAGEPVRRRPRRPLPRRLAAVTGLPVSSARRRRPRWATRWCRASPSAPSPISPTPVRRSLAGAVDERRRHTCGSRPSGPTGG